MRSIKAKILVSMVLTLAISLILVGGASCILSYRGTQSTLEASMKEMAVAAADRVSYELQAYRNIVGETEILHASPTRRSPWQKSRICSSKR